MNIFCVAGRSFGWFLMIACFGLCFTVAAEAGVILKADATDAELRLQFHWPNSVTVQSSLKGRDLLLQFSHALDCPAADTLPELAPEWIEAVSKGYDSLLIRAARDIEYSLQTGGEAIALIITPYFKAAATSELEAEQGLVRLQLLRVQLLIETDRVLEAQQLVDSLAARYPQNPLVLASRASLEERSGRWRRADALYDTALQTVPGNEDILEVRQVLLQDFRPEIEVDMGPKVVADAWNEFRLQAKGTMFLRNYLRIGFEFTQNRVALEELRQQGGELGSYRTGDRQKAEIFMQHDTEGGVRIRGSLYINDRTAGAGFRWNKPDLRGATTVQIDYGRPYWEFVESILDGGTRDRIEASREHRLTSKLNGWIIGAYNRYRLNGNEHVASSAGFNAGLDYLLAKKPLSGLQYGFDGEYRSYIETRRDSSGAGYFPIPLYNREVHSLNLHFGTDVGQRMQTEGFVGFSKDRLGGSGPFYGATVFYHLSTEFGLKLDFERRLNSVNTGEVVYQLFGKLIWKKR